MESKLSIPLSEKLKAVPAFFGIRLHETPQYEMIKHEGHFEIRKYPKQLIASTWVESNYEYFSNKAFTRLAGYIFGQNASKKDISMTTPVIVENTFIRPAKVTVGAENKNPVWKMNFILPNDISLDTAPKPDDRQTEISNETSKTWAVLKFTGSVNERIMKEKADELTSWINVLSQYRRISEARWAQYDGPMVIPFLRRNEVQMQVEKIQ